MNSYRSSVLAVKPWYFSVLISCVVTVALTPACSMSGGDDTNTILFDGGETGVSSGVSEFTYEGAGFSGGTVRTVDQPDLYGSGLFAYEVPNGGMVSISFEAPVDLLSLFFVTKGTGQTVLTAFDADGNEVGAITAAQPGSGDEDQTVPLSANAVRAEAVHTGEGEGWIDDFTFRYAASDPASGT